jgi:hypothetical protein
MGLKETIPLAICKNIEQIKPLWAHSTLPIQSVFLQKRPRHWKNAYLKAVRIRVFQLHRIGMRASRAENICLVLI